MARTRQVITRADFAALTHPLVGLRVSHLWRGHGSALFLELGKLKRPGDRTNPQGVGSIMLEWSWRVEAPRSIAFGSWSSDRKIAAGVQSLRGRRVLAMSLVGRLPELELELTEGRWVHSFMTFEGAPMWTVFLPDGSWLCVERGAVVHDNMRRARGARSA